MSGVLFYLPNARQLSLSGGLLPGWYAQFYVSGTSTPAPIYADGDLVTPLENPLQSDASGMMPPIYMDPSITYRVLLFTAAAVLIADVDPYTIQSGGGGSGVQSIVAGANITVDSTDPAHPIVSASGGGNSTEYPDPAALWYGPSGTVIAATSGQIVADPVVVWDGDQWVLFHGETVTGSPFVRSYFSTAPTLIGPWSASTAITAMAGYHKPAILVDDEGAPVQLGGNYHAYAVSYTGTLSSKEIYHFTAASLTGTWTIGSKVIPKGSAGTLDDFSTDTPCPVYKDGTIYIWYMGAPNVSQPIYGFAIRKLRAIATNADGPFTKSYTDVILPSTTPGDWDYGYMGGTQILKRPDGTYMMIHNAGDTRPVAAGREPDGSRMGYAYSASIDGPWTADRGNPYATFEGAPDGFPEGSNIWRCYVAFDPMLLKWVLFYNTGSGSEVITFAIEGVYQYEWTTGSPSYVVQTLTASQVALDSSRVNLTPGLYMVKCKVNLFCESATAHIGVALQARLSGTNEGLAVIAFIGNYAFENDDYINERIIRMVDNGYVDWSVQITEGTVGANQYARRMLIDVERL